MNPVSMLLEGGQTVREGAALDPKSGSEAFKGVLQAALGPPGNSPPAEPGVEGVDPQMPTARGNETDPSTANADALALLAAFFMDTGGVPAGPLSPPDKASGMPASSVEPISVQSVLPAALPLTSALPVDGAGPIAAGQSADQPIPALEANGPRFAQASSLLQETALGELNPLFIASEASDAKPGQTAADTSVTAAEPAPRQGAQPVDAGQELQVSQQPLPAASAAGVIVSADGVSGQGQDAQKDDSTADQEEGVVSPSNRQSETPTARQEAISPAQPARTQSSTRSALPETLAQRVVADVAERLATLAAKPRSGSVVIRLEPAELGQVVVSVRFTAQRLEADLSASQGRVAESLAARRETLQAAVEARGMTLGSLNVGTSPSGGQGSASHRQSAMSDANRMANLTAASPGAESRPSQPLYGPLGPGVDYRI